MIWLIYESHDMYNKHVLTTDDVVAFHLNGADYVNTRLQYATKPMQWYILPKKQPIVFLRMTYPGEWAHFYHGKLELLLYDVVEGNVVHDNGIAGAFLGFF